jgi:hypothetical protein
MQMQRNTDTTTPLQPGEKLWPQTITYDSHSFNPDDVVSNLEVLGHWFYWNAKEHGFYDDEVDTSFSTKLAMMHCELSEAFEAHREGNPPSEKIPGFSKIEEELADVVIRLLGDAAGRDLDVVGAIIAKGLYNVDRPRKHGSKLC